MLFDVGAGENARDNDGVLPFHRAMRVNENPVTVTLFVDAGADVGMKDDWGQIAAEFAAQCEALEFFNEHERSKDRK
ncbi:hypothetical protein [Pelagibius sp. Alg239-R121]|uniref:hypothetical protein n=1 Tax=Pelagibius sp. Alg239-R121 TaxID=2993448 RepID=UPI0024A64372|nr:hypothetical protein [Pelagibius sp. Alg239-R121]